MGHAAVQRGSGGYRARVGLVAADWATATGVATAVFGFAERALLDLGTTGFCPDGCPLAADARCDRQVAHRFGCYEAERWGGLYIYYCPMSLIFVATLVHEDAAVHEDCAVPEDATPGYGIISGPLVMGPLEDLLTDVDPGLETVLATLPSRSTVEVNALARVQAAVCRGMWSGPAADTVLPGDSIPVVPDDEAVPVLAGPATSASAPMEPAPSSLAASSLAAAPDLTDPSSAAVSKRPSLAAPAAAAPSPACDPSHGYPFEVERKLVAMIRRGDRAGAAELINHLLSILYLSTHGDVPQLRRGSTELITLFSRAAIEGGADAGVIFGEKQVLDARLARSGTLDELSALLVSVFNRFVGYVFDFSQFQHANALRQVVGYIRAHYAKHITLADAAREVWLSPSYLSSVFSAEMGMSFTAYVQSVRIDRSKELLLGTRRTIADIASATGFADQSYFTKVFTRATGVPPTQFRRQQVDRHG